MEQQINYTIPKDEMKTLLLRQLSSFFPPLSVEEKVQLDRIWDVALSKSVYNFSKSDNKYFSSQIDGIRVTNVNPFHSIQWMTILYYCSNELYKVGSSLCDRVYYLNKIMHSVDLFYAIDLPKIWSAEHPLGSVMGRAKYSDGFFFYQGCTVGGTRDKNNNPCYPEIEENVHMYSNSSILGRCHIGKNVNIGAGCIVKNQDIPENSTVFGESPNLVIKPHK